MILHSIRNKYSKNVSNLNTKPRRQSNFDLTWPNSPALRKYLLWILLVDRWKIKSIHYKNKSHGVVVWLYDLFPWLSIVWISGDSSDLLFKMKQTGFFWQ